MVDKEQRFFNLGNIYREYCGAPLEKRRQALRHYVRSWFANRKGIPGNFEDVGPDLLPAVRNRCSFEIARLKAHIDGLPSLDWPSRVIANHLAVSLVYDLPEALVQVQRHHLSDWDRSLQEALTIACDNLRRISDHPWDCPYPGVWVSPWRDNHDASRFVVTDLLQAIPVLGTHVAMVPNRDTLIVTGSEDEKRVVTVHPDSPLSAVARSMEEHNVGAVVITENRKPIGLVTDRDLALQLGARGLPPQTLVHKVMSQPVHTVYSADGIFDTTQVMMEQGIRRLPVVDDDGLLVGLVTLDDLLRVLNRELSNLAQGIKSEMEVKA